MNEYIIQDRSLSTKWALKVVDEQPNYEASSNAAQPDIIVQDIDNAGTYWKVFIDDGEIGIESATASDIKVILYDETAKKYYLFVVIDDQPAFVEYFVKDPSGNVIAIDESPNTITLADIDRNTAIFFNKNTIIKRIKANIIVMTEIKHRIMT